MTADEIKALRDRLGLSTADLAKRLGVDVRTVQYWEVGERKPGGAVKILLARLAKTKGKKGGEL